MRVTIASLRLVAPRFLEQVKRAAVCGLLSVSLVLAGTPRATRAYDPVEPEAAAPAARPAGNGGLAAAMAAGEADAQADTSGGLWFAAGCLIGVVGVILGYVVEPSPPPTRMLGKSPEYVTAYTQSYRYAGKKEQGSKALTGCLLGTAIAVAIYAVLVASVANDASTTTY